MTLRLQPLALALLVAAASPTHALNRCEISGKIEYRDLPCPPVGKATEVRVDAMRPSEEDAAYARRRTDLDISRTRTYSPVNVDQQLRRGAKIDTKSVRRDAVRCDQALRRVQLAQDRARARPEDTSLANHALNLRQNYELDCR